LYSGIILAAGKSERMGFCKQLLKIRGKTLIEIVLETAKKSKLDEIIVVLGYKAELIEKVLRDYTGIKKIFNPHFQEGLSSSLKSGLAALDSSSRAAIFILADQPLLKKSTIDALIDAHAKKHSLLVAPVYKGIRGNPVLVDRRLFTEILKLKGDVGARHILQKFKNDVLLVNVNDPGVVLDIDTVLDYKAISKIICDCNRF